MAASVSSIRCSQHDDAILPTSYWIFLCRLFSSLIHWSIQKPWSSFLFSSRRPKLDRVAICHASCYGTFSSCSWLVGSNCKGQAATHNYLMLYTHWSSSSSGYLVFQAYSLIYPYSICKCICSCSSPYLLSGCSLILSAQIHIYFVLVSGNTKLTYF